MLNATLVLDLSECSWLREGMAESRRGEKGEDNNIVTIINVWLTGCPLNSRLFIFLSF